MFLVQGIYILLAFVCIYRYGSNIKEVVLLNIGHRDDDLKPHWEDFLM